MPSLLRNLTVQKIFRVPAALIVSITRTSLKEFIRRGERERPETFSQSRSMRCKCDHHNCAVDDAWPTGRLFSQTCLRSAMFSNPRRKCYVPAWLAFVNPSASAPATEQQPARRCGTAQYSLLLPLPLPHEHLSSSSLVVRHPALPLQSDSKHEPKMNWTSTTIVKKKKNFMPTHPM